MSEMIRYRNSDKEISIKLINPMTESHGMDIDKKSHSRLLLLKKWLGIHTRVVDIYATPQDQE
jgi:hypothetical protein